MTRSQRDNEGGYTWTVTFLTAVGDVPQLQVLRDDLIGIDASINVSTSVQGNSLGGNFTLNIFGNTTRSLSHDIDSSTMKQALEEDVGSIETAEVKRSDPRSDFADEAHDWSLRSRYMQKWSWSCWRIRLDSYNHNICRKCSLHVPNKSHRWICMGAVQNMTPGSRLLGEGANISVVPHHTRKHHLSFASLPKDNIAIFTVIWGIRELVLIHRGQRRGPQCSRDAI